MLLQARTAQSTKRLRVLRPICAMQTRSACTRVANGSVREAVQGGGAAAVALVAAALAAGASPASSTPCTAPRDAGCTDGSANEGAVRATLLIFGAVVTLAALALLTRARQLYASSFAQRALQALANCQHSLRSIAARCVNAPALLIFETSPEALRRAKRFSAATDLERAPITLGLDCRKRVKAHKAQPWPR